MSQRNTQQRLASLESQLAQLREEVRAGSGAIAKSWRRAVEKFAGDDELLQMFRDAMRLREAEREAARKRRPVGRRKSR